MTLNARAFVGQTNILMLTLDTLRFDAAMCARIPNLQRWLPGGIWEKRHSPGSFTFAAHQAFFAGFLPTPAYPGKHPRLFAAQFAGSETTTDSTFVFDAPDIVTGLAALNYHTICIGGVGFFNKQTPLSRVLPALFHESHWHPSLGVTDPDSTANQVRLACSILEGLPRTQRVFLFINVSALHQPNYFYLSGAHSDTLESQIAALEYVDQQLPSLFTAMRSCGDTLAIVCSDHGTAYGEEGFYGHRLAHPVVWEVPYAEFVIPGE